MSPETHLSRNFNRSHSAQDDRARSNFLNFFTFRYRYVGDLHKEMGRASVRGVPEFVSDWRNS